MKKLVFSVLFLSLVGAMMVVPASADAVYTSGPANGSFSYWEISGSDAVTNSFTVSNSGYATMATFVVWLNPGETLNSVNWSLGTTQYGTQLGHGTASVTALSSYYNSTAGDDIVTEEISGLHSTFSVGTTYYFSLTGASATGGGNYTVGWDENDGLSHGFATTATSYYDPATQDYTILNQSNSISAFDAYPGNVDFGGTGTYPGLTGGETFALFSPEPSSFLLLGSGLAGLAGLLKRKLAA